MRTTADSGEFPAMTGTQLRRVGTVLAGMAGAGVGLTLGLAYRSFERGSVLLAIAIVAAGVLLAVSLLFQVLQMRVLAQLLDRRPASHDHGDLGRRILAVEAELGVRSAPPIVLDEPSDTPTPEPTR